MAGPFSTIHAAFHREDTRAYRSVQGTIWFLIFVSIAMLIAEPFIPKGTRLTKAFEWADRALLIVFAVEYALRVLSYRPAALQVFQPGPMVRARTHVLARLRFALRPMLLIDLLAVLAVFPELRGLRALRLLRLLRTVKLFRYSNPFTSIFHAFEENSLLFVFGFTVLFVETILGGVSLYLVEVGHNPDVTSIADGLWWALVTITTVGFGDIAPETLSGRLIGGALMIGGMFTLALFAGFVGSSLVNAMLTIREEQFRMGNYVNHVVICGYDATGDLLLELVDSEIDTDKVRIVVFDNQERPRNVPPHFLWVEGDPTKESELDKVRLTHAQAVIIVGSRATDPQAADARTILTTFTIRAHLEKNADKTKSRHIPLYIVAEVLDAENVEHARAAGADEVVETRRLGFSMLAHTVSFHGTADSMSSVLLSGNYNPYVGQIPSELELPMSYGEVLTTLKLTKRGGLIIAIRDPRSGDVFNPKKDYEIVPGTTLVYLAEGPVLDPP